MFETLFLIAKLVSAGGSLAAGVGAKKSADLNAYNIETQREMARTEARQRSNDRIRELTENTSANIAFLTSQGRDMESRSVSTFLTAQRDKAAQDVRRSDLMGQLEQLKYSQQAAATRAEGRAQMASSAIGAFTTVAGALYQYNDVRAGSEPSTSYAPLTSPRPRAR